MRSSSLGKECNPFAASATNNVNAIDPEESEPDVGVLAAGCHPLRQACVPDASSSLGGRCRARADERAPERTTRGRRLEEEDFDPFDASVCEKKCPSELCDCAATTTYGFPDAQDCAPELRSVCHGGDVKNCFPKEEKAFYEGVYCAFADCWLDSDQERDDYVECTCQYYENYCDLYGDYADDYPKVAAQCAAAHCCIQFDTSEEKDACFKSSAPSVAPSMLVCCSVSSCNSFSN